MFYAWSCFHILISEDRMEDSLILLSKTLIGTLTLIILFEILMLL